MRLELGKHLFIRLIIFTLEAKRNILTLSHSHIWLSLKIRYCTVVELHSCFHLLSEILELTLINSQNAIVLIVSTSVNIRGFSTYSFWWIMRPVRLWYFMSRSIDFFFSQNWSSLWFTLDSWRLIFLFTYVQYDLGLF